MDEQQSQKKSSRTLIGIILAACVVVLGGVIAFTSGIFNGSNPASKTNNNPPPTTTPATSAYKDGTYSVTQSYRSPGATEKFGLSLTLANSIVTAATFTPEPVSSFGKMHQDAFSQQFQQYVVGKNIDAVSIAVIAGASLTSAAFMQALTTIKAKAQA